MTSHYLNPVGGRPCFTDAMFKMNDLALSGLSSSTSVSKTTVPQ